MCQTFAWWNKLHFLGFLFYPCYGNFMDFKKQMVLCHICNTLMSLMQVHSIHENYFHPYNLIQATFQFCTFSYLFFVVQHCTLLTDIIKQTPEEKLLKPPIGCCFSIISGWLSYTVQHYFTVIQPKWEKILSYYCTCWMKQLYFSVLAG